MTNSRNVVGGDGKIRKCFREIFTNLGEKRDAV